MNKHYYTLIELLVTTVIIALMFVLVLCLLGVGIYLIFAPYLT